MIIKDLKQIRKNLDNLDNELVKILSKRMNLVYNIIEYKKINNLPVVQKKTILA